jgi:predicted nucleic acid-binding protein
MVAIEANVLVRFLTGDDPGQAAKARALFEREAVFVATTVVPETEWVLRSACGFGREAVVGAGFDFADALHLATPQAAQGFATFDTRLVGAERRAGLAGMREP